METETSTINEKSDRDVWLAIFEDLQKIKAKLEIQEKRFITITDYEGTISNYENFAESELNLNSGTIKNHVAVLRKFLESVSGDITEDTVRDYLDSVESSKQSNQLKALRRFIRDYLKLGNWINDVSFKTVKTKLKTQNLPNNEELGTFCSNIETLEIQIIFFICFNSGLRINEVLEIETEKIDYDLNCIDVSEIHTGDTKSSWYGFFTEQTKEYLENYILNNSRYEKVFSVTYDQVYAEFKRVSEITEIELTPKSLRMVFVERCIDVKMDKNVIDIFEGRIPKGVQSKIYRNYSPERLKEHYGKVEKLLIL